jgi:hypothetical protein
MHPHDNNRQGADIAIEYTSKPVSGWGGLALVGRFFSHMGVGEFLERALPDGRTSPNRVPVRDIGLQLMATVLTGGSRFAHSARIAHDQVLKSIFGVERFGDPMTLTRYFGAFSRSQSELLQRYIGQITAQLLRDRSDDVLDLDSTVFSRCGEQEGAERGYNPSRRGRQCHQALLALLAESKLVLHNWLRSGSASSCRGVNEFFREIVGSLPKGFAIRAVRADSGFCSTEFFETLETHATPYAISLRLTRPLKRWAAGLTVWTAIAGSDGVEVAEGMFHPAYWKSSRRVIVKRKRIRTSDKGLLFEVIDWDYYAVATTLSIPTAEVWRFYNGRGDCENRIKELKYDFNADGFCLRSFDGTDAVFRLNCLLFNLIAEFKRTVLQDTSITLAIIRTKVFVIGALLGANGRTKLLRLGLTARWQNDFKILLARLAQLAASTVVHFHNLLDPLILDRPSPWRAKSPSSLWT